MTDPIPVNLAVEDSVSEQVLQRLLLVGRQQYAVGACYSEGGFGYLKRQIRGFNVAARGTPFIVLTDLDRAACAPTLLDDWLPVPRHPNLVFRVAVREVEAWLLADAEGIARFLRVKKAHVPPTPESLADPKGTLIGLARRSRSSSIREDIVPPRGSSRVQGPNYNGRLEVFVRNEWNPRLAAASAESLRRAIRVLAKFRPTWNSTA